MRGLAFAALLACGCAQTAERVGDRFVDLYLVEIDQARARELTSGLATKKLDDELRLVADVRRTVDRAAAKPTVFYRRRSARVEGERAQLAYDVTVKFGADATKKNALLSMERTDGRWRVANFIVDD